MLQIIKISLLLLIFSISTVYGKNITPNEVYSQVSLIDDELHSILSHYNIKYNDDKINKSSKIDIDLKPRNVWQKSYEIMIKINILRDTHKLPRIQPVNMSPVLHLHPDAVYEQTQRILTELRIFKFRMNIPRNSFHTKKFINKKPLDVFIGLDKISRLLDLLYKGGLTPSFVFAENMKVYDDISLILSFLEIEDNTIPRFKNKNATPNDTFKTALQILEKIKQLQINVGMNFVDFSAFEKENAVPGDVFTLTQMIISELQTLKAYVGINSITPTALEYQTKTPIEVDQLMSWNLRKLNLINSLYKVK